MPDEKTENVEVISSNEEENTSLVCSEGSSDINNRNPKEFLTLKEELLKKHHGNFVSLYDKIKSNPDGSSIEVAISAIIEELIGETDNLKGNELVFSYDGKIHDATTIAVKRAEILDTVSKVLARKKDLLNKSNKVDLDSSAFHMYQSLCFQKLTEVLDELGYDDESKQVIVLRWGEKMSSWKSELKRKLENLGNLAKETQVL